MSPLGIVLLIVLILILFGGIGPTFYQGAPWRPYYGVHPGGFGIVWIILLILVVLVLVGRIPF
jgi:hypothetical protein